MEYFYNNSKNIFFKERYLTRVSMLQRRGNDTQINRPTFKLIKFKLFEFKNTDWLFSWK